MARIDWIETRLLNWARWKAQRGGGALGYVAVDLTRWADMDAGRQRSGYITTAPVPISDVEASETDDAVERLPSELRATVQAFYLSTGTRRELLQRLVISEPTLYARIGRAHRLLADHFAAQQDRQREERERVERLQRGEFYGR